MNKATHLDLRDWGHKLPGVSRDVFHSSAGIRRGAFVTPNSILWHSAECGRADRRGASVALIILPMVAERRRFMRSVFFVLAFLVLCSFSIMGQGVFGTISGVVTDPRGALVPGAIVKVTNVDTNVTKTLTTNNEGVYSATSLNPGLYKLEASASGFKTAIVSAISLGVSANPKVDFALQVGETSEMVIVA